MKKVLLSILLLLYVSVNAFAQEQKSKKQEQKSEKEKVLEELYNEFEQEQQREKKKKFLEYLRKQKSKSIIIEEDIIEEDISEKYIDFGLSFRLGSIGGLTMYGGSFKVVGSYKAPLMGSLGIDVGTGDLLSILNINPKFGYGFSKGWYPYIGAAVLVLSVKVPVQEKVTMYEPLYDVWGEYVRDHKFDTIITKYETKTNTTFDFLIGSHFKFGRIGLDLSYQFKGSIFMAGITIYIFRKEPND